MLVAGIQNHLLESAVEDFARERQAVKNVQVSVKLLFPSPVSLDFL